MTYQIPTSARQLTVTGASLLAAPLFMTGYGAVRLLSGHRAPGAAWTAGHLLLILGLLCFVPIVLYLRRLAAEQGTARRLTANAAAAATLLGVCSVLGQAVVDIYVASVSVDHAAMNVRFHRFQSHPGVEPLLYTVLPLFFYLGLVVLTAVLALGRPRLTALRIPVLVLLGTVVMAVSLDLLPLGGLVFAAAFGPLGLAMLTEARTPQSAVPSTTPARTRV
ncbi:hypothetical protein ACEZCY_14935 [Streptacidiphilus sp. N1-12]|uniref:DUF4386 family protein n=2 Tax=Streptacidiphilus alkalitolerans TaxID=3342712 RepID=A0ABV6V9Z0_9ACTN